MTSKLDYLQRYLAKPGEGVSASQKTRSTKAGSRRASAEANVKALQIRDLSEALPKPRVQKENLGAAGELAQIVEDADAEFVDEKEVEAAQKVELETSGVRWKISQHRKNSFSNQGRRLNAAVGGDGDLSPPRRPARQDNDCKGQRKPTVKQESDSEWSSPRLPGKTVCSINQSDSDISPPRSAAVSMQPRKVCAVNESSERNANAPHCEKDGSDSDISPPRHAEKAVKLAHAEDSDADISPPRQARYDVERLQKLDSDEDLSPPRAAGKNASGSNPKDALPRQPPYKAKHDFDADTAPCRGAAPRKQRHDSDSDISPPRPEVQATQNGTTRHSVGGSTKRKQRHDSDSDLSPPRPGTDEGAKMSSGLRAGLVAGDALKAEVSEVREKRRVALEATADADTGRGAETVYRAQDGALIEREAWVDQQQKKKRKRLSEYPEQELEWGGGVKQQHDKEQEMEELSRIAAQPFARFQPDEKYLEELREKQDWNDPMRKKQDEEMAGFEEGCADAERKQRPTCPHGPWLNRFGILPGYRWDGKIRGNNFEQRWLETQNHKEFQKKDAWMRDELNA